MALSFLSMIDALERGDVSARAFSSAVEHEWNFGDERATLSVKERAAVQRLFDVVVYYSEFREERERIPIYRNEEDVLMAARACRQILLSGTG